MYINENSIAVVGWKKLKQIRFQEFHNYSTLLTLGLLALKIRTQFIFLHGWVEDGGLMRFARRWAQVAIQTHDDSRIAMATACASRLTLSHFRKTPTRRVCQIFPTSYYSERLMATDTHRITWRPMHRQREANVFFCTRRMFIFQTERLNGRERARVLIFGQVRKTRLLSGLLHTPNAWQVRLSEVIGGCFPTPAEQINAEVFFAKSGVNLISCCSTAKKHPVDASRCAIK